MTFVKPCREPHSVLAGCIGEKTTIIPCPYTFLLKFPFPPLDMWCQLQYPFLRIGIESCPPCRPAPRGRMGPNPVPSCTQHSTRLARVMLARSSALLRAKHQHCAPPQCKLFSNKTKCTTAPCCQCQVTENQTSTKKYAPPSFNVPICCSST